MCSTVVNQWVSKITSVSPLTASIAWRSLPKPSTMLVSTPPPIRSRIGFGAMTPGWWLTTAAPTISPIAGSLVDERVLADRAVLDVAVKVETPRPALPADAGIARPAERGPELADEEAVHPHRTGNDARGDAHGPILVAGEQGGREAVLGGVGDLDHLVVAAGRSPGPGARRLSWSAGSKAHPDCVARRPRGSRRLPCGPGRRTLARVRNARDGSADLLGSTGRADRPRSCGRRPRAPGRGTCRRSCPPRARAFRPGRPGPH